MTTSLNLRNTRGSSTYNNTGLQGEIRAKDQEILRRFEVHRLDCKSTRTSKASNRQHSVLRRQKSSNEKHQFLRYSMSTESNGKTQEVLEEPLF